MAENEDYKNKKILNIFSVKKMVEIISIIWLYDNYSTVIWKKKQRGAHIRK